LAEQTYWAIGRRKEATVRVGLRPGKGEMIVNGLPMKDYFHRETLVMLIEQPLRLVEAMGQVDFVGFAHGGGKSGQAGALLLGISRALQMMNPDYRSRLKKAGFLERDARAVERKKYGQAKARKRFQYSKR
jgi:small subunit ribosomal protein S9